MSAPTHVINRRQWRIEGIHDEQDKRMSRADYDRCVELKRVFNAAAKRSALENNKEVTLAVSVPSGTSEAALLCFVYGTRRANERPVMRGLDLDGGMKDGGSVTFPAEHLQG